MQPTEPFDAEEVRAMTSAQLGEFLGLVFGLHCSMRLTVERDCIGEVQIKLEHVIPGAVPGATIPEASPGFTPHTLRSPAWTGSAERH